MGFKDMMTGLGESFLTSSVDFGFQALANSVLPLSRAQREQNEFASSEARNARDFSAEQAEISRDWQEEMYAKYNSLQGKISQARAAGVNPMFAVTDNAVSPMPLNSSSPAAPAASSGSVSPAGRVSDIAGAALSFGKLKSEIENIQSQTRNMNAQALKTELEALWVDKLSAQTISESVSRISLAAVTEDEKRANIGLLTAKALESAATVEEKQANIKVLAAQVANLDADTDVKVKRLQEIISSVNNMDADTEVKKAMYAKVLAETKNEKLMSRLIVADTNLSRQQRREIEAKTEQLWQQYDHAAIVNEFEEYARSLQMKTEEFHNPQSSLAQICKWFCESLVEVLSLGGYTTYNRSESNSTSTVTTIDGNERPKHRRIGY